MTFPRAANPETGWKESLALFVSPAGKLFSQRLYQKIMLIPFALLSVSFTISCHDSTDGDEQYGLKDDLMSCHKGILIPQHPSTKPQRQPQK